LLYGRQEQLAVAAINTGRKYVGCEMNDEYYKKYSRQDREGT